MEYVPRFALLRPFQEAHIKSHIKEWIPTRYKLANIHFTKTKGYTI